MDFTPVEYKNVTMTEAEMLDLFYNKFGEIPLLSRMDAVADTFIDEVETLKNKDLPEEEKQELIERFRQMYDTRDFYVPVQPFSGGGRAAPAARPSARENGSLPTRTFIPSFISNTGFRSARAARISNIWWWMRCRITPASSI